MFKLKLIGSKENELQVKVDELERKLASKNAMDESDTYINEAWEAIENHKRDITIAETALSNNIEIYKHDIDVKNLKKLNDLERKNHEAMIDIINVNAENQKVLMDSHRTDMANTVKSFNDSISSLIVGVTQGLPKIKVDTLPTVEITTTNNGKLK